MGVFNEDGTLVGFILHCAAKHRPELVYNGGTGVLPAYRGRGLTKAMYAHFFQQIDELGIEEVVLEVLENNKIAYACYEYSGFKRSRKLLSYKWTPGDTAVAGTETSAEVSVASANQAAESPSGSVNLPAEPITSFPIRIARSSYQAALESECRSFLSILPTWQNDFQAMELTKDDLQAYLAHSDEEFVGYLLYNTRSKRIHQLAVRPDYRRTGVGQALLRKTLTEHPHLTTIINIDDRDPSLPSFLKKHGFQDLVRLYEMRWSKPR